MPALPRLIQANGQPRFGHFPQGVEQINYMDYDWRTVMDKPKSQLAKRFGHNQFQFISLSNDQFILGVAIVDLKLVSNAFVYVYHIARQQFDEWRWISPLSWGTQCDNRPNQGGCYFRKGDVEISIQARRNPAVRVLQISGVKGLTLEATLDESSQYQPLALCSRAGYDGWSFTQKSTAQLCQGRLHYQGELFDLGQMNTLAAVDWSGGFMRRDTFWNWSSISTFLEDGRRFGMNLAAGVNETGTTENAIWLDGRLHTIGGVNFQFDRYHPKNSWGMQSNDGVIDLHFTPMGVRKEKLNVGWLASNFRQYYGLYQGDIHLKNETLHLNNVWGLAEDHYARW